DWSEGRPRIACRDGPQESWTFAILVLSADDAGFTEAVVAAGIADDQVIDEWHFEQVGRVGKPQRQSGIVFARCRIPTGVGVHEEQSSRVGREACEHEDIQQPDWVTLTRPPREDVPGYETVGR